MKAGNFSIVFYDGDCGFCNHSVQFILSNRRHDQFQFVKLQTNKAKELLTPFDITISMETIYVIQNHKVYQKSSAILILTNELKGIYQLLKVGYIIPPFIRDWLYRMVSRNRHKIKNGFCVMPLEDEKKLFSN